MRHDLTDICNFIKFSYKYINEVSTAGIRQFQKITKKSQFTLHQTLILLAKIAPNVIFLKKKTTTTKTKQHSL